MALSLQSYFGRRAKFGCATRLANVIFALTCERLVQFIWNKKEVHQLDGGLIVSPRPLTLPITMTLDFLGQVLTELCLRNGIAGWCGMKGVWVGRIWTHYVTLNYDINLGYSRSNFEIAVSHEWDGHWHGTTGMSLCDHKLWPQPLESKSNF